MNRNELLQRITHHIHRVTRRNLSVTERSQLDYRELGLNSVQILSVLVCLEDELGVEIDELLADVQKLHVVGDLVDHLAQMQVG